MAEIKIRIEIHWGKKWNGSYYEETKGEGLYVTAMETRGNHFTGCPLGRVHASNDVPDTIERAIADFMMYGKHEYTGEGKLTRDKIEIVETRDWRS